MIQKRIEKEIKAIRDLPELPLNADAVNAEQFVFRIGTIPMIHRFPSYNRFRTIQARLKLLIYLIPLEPTSIPEIREQLDELIDKVDSDMPFQERIAYQKFKGDYFREARTYLQAYFKPLYPWQLWVRGKSWSRFLDHLPYDTVMDLIAVSLYANGVAKKKQRIINQRKLDPTSVDQWMKSAWIDSSENTSQPQSLGEILGHT